MNLLVTGGAGFIGSNFIHYLLDSYDDIKIVNFDKLTYAGNLNNLKNIENDSRYKFVKGDICDSKLVSDVFKNEGRGGQAMHLPNRWLRHNHRLRERSH